MIWKKCLETHTTAPSSPGCQCFTLRDGSHWHPVTYSHLAPKLEGPGMQATNSPKWHWLKLEYERDSVLKVHQCRTISKIIIHVRYIYIYIIYIYILYTHIWLNIFMVNVGKYTVRPMDWDWVSCPSSSSWLPSIKGQWWSFWKIHSDRNSVTCVFFQEGFWNMVK